ncbi:tyrosine-protein phosphatase YwqE [Sphingobacterium allocomposti]|uniref:protein-tyrosine-phosphatase n=1 Tax=Sphingobacterium allocomposti TaxID=415956 RepID=A0A5S5DIY4_9SPHI|nr:CpsB/CapC family capsule biosynthesis tyrosine phosphatase [Sphingobacterium composti Yoo et al. 2007 non Ten et al. 2007]TYP94649.1 tyrosine-protein phosphatase YwqE [Sphingobacterium composti Yoo et al. 2007 non Ten et al. 2007]
MGFWNNLFGKKQKAEILKHDLSWLGWDMHNHLLPGIDDGSPDLETSVRLVKGLKDLGIKHAVATPHVMHGVHNNNPVTIKEAYQKLTSALKEEDVTFDLHYSAEYMIDDQLAELIRTNNLCPLPNKCMLIEMSYLSESKALFQTIKDIQEKGYQPILAHPERYNYYHQNFKVFKEIKKAGCLLQLNVLSVSRYYGEHVKSAALMLIKSGMYDLVGTDMHHERHLRAIKEVLTKYNLEELLKGNAIQNRTLFGKQDDLSLAI